MSLTLCRLLSRTSIASNVCPRFASTSFRSDLSPDKLHPNSKNVKPFEPPESDGNQFSGYIPIKELEITYSKASGAGGQHVNKTATKVDIRFHVKSARWLSEETRKKLLERYPTRINKDGYFVMRSEKTKESLLNTLDAMTKLREILYKVEEPLPKMSEECEERIRKGKEKAIRQRLVEKRMHSLKKMSRRGADFD